MYEQELDFIRAIYAEKFNTTVAFEQNLHKTSTSMVKEKEFDGVNCHYVECFDQFDGVKREEIIGPVGHVNKDIITRINQAYFQHIKEERKLREMKHELHILHLLEQIVTSAASRNCILTDAELQMIHSIK